MFTLVDINAESFDKVWTLYCKSNRASVKKAYDKEKARKQARERRDNFKGGNIIPCRRILNRDKTNKR